MVIVCGFDFDVVGLYEFVGYCVFGCIGEEWW